MAMEQWLRDLPLAPKSKVHIRSLMHLVMKCAERWEVLAVRQNCLVPNNLVPSIELGDLLRARSIQGLVFRSAVGRGKNLIVYLEHCLPNALEIHNASELIRKMRHILKPPLRG